MVWISVDELLEQVMLKLYKSWDAGALARLRPWLDEERLRLGTALRSLASAHVTQSEDAILLFLDRLAGQEPIVALAREELEALSEVKQLRLRTRSSVLGRRGPRSKPTNLTPVRLQALLTLLEAVEPPAYAVTRMYLPGGGEDLTELLEYVVVQIYGNWSRLALETRDAVLRTLNTVRAGMVNEDGQVTVNVRNVVETLHLFEAMPETLHYACHAFLAGKIDAAPETPPQLYSQSPISERLAELLTHPMPLAGAIPSGEAVMRPPERDREPQPAPPPSVSAPEAGPSPEPSPERGEPAPQPTPEEEAALPAQPVPPQPPAPGEPVQPAPPRFLRDSIPPREAVSEREFYTDVRFPQQVRVGDEVPLIVRLTRAPWAASRVSGNAAPDFEQLDRPEYVEVVVVAAGFNEGTATWSRTIAVYSDRDSQPAIFLLRAGRELGNKRVTIDFYHKARYLGSAAFVTKVVDQAPSALAGVTVDSSELVTRFLDQPPPPADLELRIVRGGSDNLLSFMLHSTKAGVGYHWRPMGQVRLNAATPQAYLETIFAHLSQQAAKPVEPLPEDSVAEDSVAEDSVAEDNVQVDEDKIAAIGRRLFRDLFPAELQHEFWTRIHPRRRDAAHPEGAIETLLITSDEPWIPWEMVKPFLTDPDSGVEQSDGYLAETFQVSRWLAGRGPVDTVRIQSAGIVAPGTDTNYAQREEAFFQSLPDRRVQVGEPLRSTAAVRQLVQAGGVQLLHVAAHGRREADNADLSPLSLADGSLTPLDLAGERAAGLRQERPLVFLNICHTARPAFALTGLGGWAERMVEDLKVSALVGTLWEVNDLLAAEFAVAFYERLMAGDTLGRALHTARLHVRDRQPGNSTWLAYVLYADPNSAVYWGGEAGPGEEPEPSLLPIPTPEPEPEPAVDLEALRAVLEGALAGSLTELVQRSIPAAVATALDLWTSPPAPEEEEAATEEPGEEPAPAEPPAEEPPAEEPPAEGPVAQEPPPEQPPAEEPASEAPAAEQPPGGEQPPAGDATPGPQPAEAEPPAAPSVGDEFSWMPADWLSAREAGLRQEAASEWPDSLEAGASEVEERETGASEGGPLEEDAPGKDG